MMRTAATSYTATDLDLVLTGGLPLKFGSKRYRSLESELAELGCALDDLGYTGRSLVRSYCAAPVTRSGAAAIDAAHARLEAAGY